MKTLGMIVRADSGGLGNQTFEIWRHLQPEQTMVVGALPGGRRGMDRPKRYLSEFTTVWKAENARIRPQLLKQFAQVCDKVFFVEAAYCAHACEIMRHEGAQVVQLANPELYRENEHGRPDLLRVPTDWVLEQMHGAKVLPQPVALDRFEHRTRPDGGDLLTFYHPWAPAFHDRNGTELVQQALGLVRQPCRVIIRAPMAQRSGIQRRGKVEVVWLDRSTDEYWESYPPEADVLLLPRRYGGLSLSVLEAAAAGMPALMTDLSPQTGWPGVEVFPVRRSKRVAMKGGTFPVWDASPRDLARSIDRLVVEPERVRRLSDQAWEWAQANSWGELLPQWVGTLR